MDAMDPRWKNDGISQMQAGDDSRISRTIDIRPSTAPVVRDMRENIIDAARLAGAALILAAGAIHLWLFFDYFHHIHMVGALFVVNFAAAVVIGLTLTLSPSLWASGAGIAYAAGTLGAFFISVYRGLFGYVETLNGGWQAAAGGVEAAAIVVLLLFIAARSLALRRTGTPVVPRAHAGERS